jgi:dihydropteroate synthase
MVMAVVNCTPDSFSDGGRFLDARDAVRHAERLIEEGADIVDVGGESTRPGAEPVAVIQETERIVPVIYERRSRHPDAVISVDTSKTAVAEAALGAGADLVNDVTAGSGRGMLELVAERDAGIIVMHMRKDPRTMQRDTHYDDVVEEVFCFLAERARAAVAAGIPAERVWVDPGLGFGKDADGNIDLLTAMPRLAELGHPVVIGPSRKSFIGRITGAAVDERLPGTLAALIPAVGLDRAVVRVHDVAPVRQFLAVACRVHGAHA